MNPNSDMSSGAFGGVNQLHGQGYPLYGHSPMGPNDFERSHLHEGIPLHQSAVNMPTPDQQQAEAQAQMLAQMQKLMLEQMQAGPNLFQIFNTLKGVSQGPTENGHSNGHSHGGQSSGHSHNKQSSSQDPADVKLIEEKHKAVEEGLFMHLLQMKLMSNQQTVHERDLNGNTIFHHIVAEGKMSMLMPLLQFGAHVNAKNDNDETAVHMGCRSGNPKLVYLLIQNGGDLALKNKMGRGCMHFAAESGSVHTMHYLAEVHGLKTDELDIYLQSPLHIACEKKHVNVVEYLLKNQRCSAEQADRDGNTPIHISAKNGSGHICWLLLRATKCRFLWDANKDGLTPHQLAKQGRSKEHQETANFLSSTLKTGLKHSVPKVPLSAYFPAVVPTLLFFIGIFLAEYVEMFSNYKGTVIFITALYMVYAAFTGSHRVSHVSRAPGPIQASSFFLGTVITVLCLMGKILPMIYEDHWTISVVSILIPLLFYYFFYKVLRLDPGYTVQPKMKDSGGYYMLKDVVEGPYSYYAWCETCELIPVKPSKHCRLCDRCVYRMDHHCLFTMNCVGNKNHLTFFKFLVTTLSTNIAFLIVSFIYLQELYPKDKDGEINSLWALLKNEATYNEPLLFGLMVFNIAIGLWVVSLSLQCLYVRSGGFTFAFRPPGFPQHSSTLTGEEKCANIIYFLSGRDKIIQDPLYQPY